MHFYELLLTENYPWASAALYVERLEALSYYLATDRDVNTQDADRTTAPDLHPRISSHMALHFLSLFAHMEGTRVYLTGLR